MRNISWHSFDLRSGRRGVRVVTKELGTVSRIIGEATDTSLDTLCTAPEWDLSTEPGRTMLVALDTEDESIVWGGMVLRRDSNATEWVGVSLMTLEHYFDRRFASDMLYAGTDQATIAAGLIGMLAVDGLDFTIDAPASGALLDRAYLGDEDKTVLSALTELLETDGGPEFTVDLEWSDSSHTQIDRVARVRNRLGSAPALTTQWTLPGCVTDFSLIEDFTADYGANDVLAVSSGEGDTRPTSGHKVAQDLIDAGWARFEMRYTPATSITSFAQLEDHATARLADAKDGLTQLSLVADLDTAPRLNVDWWLGDDITASLTCPRFPEQAGPDGGFVPGYTHRVRVVGWEIDYDARVLTPTIREVA